MVLLVRLQLPNYFFAFSSQLQILLKCGDYAVFDNTKLIRVDADSLAYYASESRGFSDSRKIDDPYGSSY
jgi:hypothetical protein